MTTYNGRFLIAVFALVAVVGTAVVTVLAGGGPEEVGVAFGAGIGASLAVLGAYTISTRRGLPHSHSVALAGITLGAVYALALVYRLLTEFGA